MAQSAISRYGFHYYDIGHNYEPLTKLCHVVYATLGKFTVRLHMLFHEKNFYIGSIRLASQVVFTAFYKQVLCYQCKEKTISIVAEN